jgi:hypothetical protein
MDTYAIELDRIQMLVKVERVLESMQLRLKAYANRSDADQQSIDQRQTEILTIFRYLTMANSVIQGLESARQAAYNEGFRAGQEHVSKQDIYGYRSIRERRTQLGAESFRSIHNSAQREKWNDLY